VQAPVFDACWEKQGQEVNGTDRLRGGFYTQIFFMFILVLTKKRTKKVKKVLMKFCLRQTAAKSALHALFR
jgi:hypothetical protein